MAFGDVFEAADFMEARANEMAERFARTHRDVAYADLRFEGAFQRAAAAQNGEPRENTENESAGLGVSVYARGGARGESAGYGYCGMEIGGLALISTRLAAAIGRALGEALGRARLDARVKAAAMSRLGARSSAALDGGFAARAAIRGRAEAIFRIDPRTLDARALSRLALEASRAAKGAGPEIAFNAVEAAAELRHEIFASTEGTLISQMFAFSQGDCYVVAEGTNGHQEIYDTIGQQRGFEALAEGLSGESLSNAGLVDFSAALAGEARELAAAPALTPPQGEVTVVTDPHFNALLAHEIIGHPSEADRALKMEAAYAGRSWFFRALDDNEVGRAVASPLLSACSDPTLNGYGHYRYDHEGTPARRVMHIDAGVFRGFLNSRRTAAVLGAEPNGSARASEACHVPLVRMSNTFFMPGGTPPEKIIGEVERGYYVAGHQIPSIAESRENFRISTRRVYEIDHGRLGRLYRAGSVMADSKRFLSSVDAVGDDLRLIAIPNCGKGQPMQLKRMSNGGPTLRSRARLAGG